MPRLWRVVGGADRGGILVRSGWELTSSREGSRLSTGALLEEKELVGERLRYLRLKGVGPLSGWVSLRADGAELVALDIEEALRRSRAEQSDPSRPERPELRGDEPPGSLGTAAEIDSLPGTIEPEILSTLNRDGLAVLDGVLSADALAALRAEAEGLLAGGRLLASMQQRFGRTDRYAFLGEADCLGAGCPRLAGVVGCLVKLAQRLHMKTSVNRRGAARRAKEAAGSTAEAPGAGKPAWVPMRVPEKAMLAVYDGGGARYPAHRDNALDGGSEEAARRSTLEKNARHLTMLLYLNDNTWDLEDGGALRCHLAAARRMDEPGAGDEGEGCPADCRGEGGCHLDLQPLGGRLVLFFSRELLHEVTPSWRRRWALSLWAEDARIPADNHAEIRRDFAHALVRALIRKMPEDKQQEAHKRLGDAPGQQGASAPAGHAGRQTQVRGRVWEAVGSTAGLAVHTEQDELSPLAPKCLSNGALVQELELRGSRLHWRLLQGSGPASGWTSVRLSNGSIAMIKADGIWEVVRSGGGLAVQRDQNPHSAEKPGRLAAGALVREVELSGGRLLYNRLSGSGPDSGWVSVKSGGQDCLVRRGAPRRESNWLCPECLDFLPSREEPCTFCGESRGAVRLSPDGYQL